ncbi:protein NCBP2AS2 [Vespula squamosa]|uniref:Protein NCBP2AS2 n=1 Tax=Vespula squamosa TaxID=30214 RepID=A0ABD2APN6_VESSQ
MGIIRFLMQYLMNNEQLINKLADSKPIRRSAKLIVYLFSQTGKVNNVYKLKSPAEALQILKNFANNMKNELKQVRESKKKYKDTTITLTSIKKERLQKQ